MADSKTYDVVILGSGLGGSTLAAILARAGWSVLLLEAGSHPRFAIGESVVPEFGARARLMAEAFGVPELAWLSSFQLLRQRVSASSGIKRSFTFLYHREGEEHRAAETCQFQTMTYPLGPDSHIYRPDLDAWLTALAVRYGATFRERAAAEDVEIAADGVGVVAGGQRYRARFVVDGTGHRSVLAERQGLRLAPDLATDTRTLFTHMVGVRRVQDVLPGRLPVPSPPDQGTLHHVFAGGWLWVIPFDNHSLAVNPVCSVGLTLDRRIHPDSPLDAESELHAVVRRFPTVARQLAGARAVRGWVKTGRLQYRSRCIAGARFCLLPHAAGFVDALFSGGMTMTLLGVHELAAALLPALAEDRFSAERFAHLDDIARRNLEVLDRVVHGAFLAFRSHALFNAWYRIWAVGNYHGTAALNRLGLELQPKRRRQHLQAVHGAPYRLVLGMEQPRLRALLDDGYAILQRLDQGALDEAAAVDALFALLGRQAWIPPGFRITDRSRAYLASFTALPLLRTILWGKRHAPADMRELYYDVGPVYFRELTRALAREARRGLLSFLRVVRDAHFSRGRS